MSVINDMLRDLDERQALERNGANASSAAESMIEPQKQSVLKLYLLLSLVVILLIVWSVWFLFYDDRSSAHQQAVQQVISEVHVASPVAVLTDDQMALSTEAAEIKPRQMAMVSPVEGDKRSREKIRLGEVAKNDALELKKAAQVASEHKKTAPVVLTTKVAQAPSVEKKLTVNGGKVSVKPPAVEEAVSSVRNTAGDAKLATRSKAYPLVGSSLLNESAQIVVEESAASKGKAIASIDSEYLDIRVRLTPEAQDQNEANSAAELFKQNKAQQAYQGLYNFLATHEVDERSRAVLARQLLLEGRLAEAGDVLVGPIDTLSPQLRQIKARWHIAQDESQLAIDVLTVQLPEISLYTDYYVLLASYYQRFGDLEKAYETYSLLIQFDDNIADWWAGLGIASDRLNQKQQAKYAYSQASQLPGLNAGLVSFIDHRINELKYLK
jgi:tetratricopeptide (TPR) repeat protein